MGAVEIGGAQHIDRTDHGALVAGDLAGVVSREEIAVGLRDGQTDHGSIATVVSGAGTQIDRADPLTRRERRLRRELQGSQIVRHGLGRRRSGNHALLGDLPVIHRNGEAFDERDVDDHATGLAFGGFGTEREIAG